MTDWTLRDKYGRLKVRGKTFSNEDVEKLQTERDALQAQLDDPNTIRISETVAADIRRGAMDFDKVGRLVQTTLISQHAAKRETCPVCGNIDGPEEPLIQLKDGRVIACVSEWHTRLLSDQTPEKP